MKRHIAFIILYVVVLASCDQGEDIPLPEEKRAYITLYNFISGIPVVIWEVDDVGVEGGHVYGTSLPGSVLLIDTIQQVLFEARNDNTNEVLKTQKLELKVNKFYSLILFGSPDQPILLFRETDTRQPSEDNIHIQFLHAAEGLDSIDVYMGGTRLENKVFSGIAYQDLTELIEVAAYDLRASVIVSPHDSVYSQGHEIVSMKYNDLIVSASNYMTVIASESYDPESDITLWLYPLEVE